MAWVRQLPSGLWAATVRTPAGRITETHKLKGRIERWASDLESDVRRGDFIDPRASEITVGQWWERVKDARRLELASRKRDESHWRVHVAPRWAHIPVGAILRPDVATWVTSMDAAHKTNCPDRKRCRGCLVGAATIQGAVGVLRGLLEQAVDARLIRDNPATKVPMPERNAHVDRVLAPDEDTQLLDSLDRQFPGRPDGRLFVETLLYCGLRYEEAAAVDRDHVDMRRQVIQVGPVLERDGSIRPYPKSPAGIRPVPVDDDMWPRLRAHALTVRPGGLLFTAARGGTLHYSGWHRRVWLRALHGAPQARAPRSAADAGRFSDWLTERMAAAGFSLDQDLARAAGLGASLIANWRAERFRPSQKSLARLAAALQADPDELAAIAGVRGVVERGAQLDDPQPTPHDLRHSYGTRLGEQGVPVHEIMALMGHETLESAQRYLHAGEDRFDRARQAMRRARGL